MKKRVEAIVHGRVQGVFFRAYTQQTGKELGLCGYVKNTPDGCVKVVAEGEELNLKKLIEWLYQGSPASNVNKVDYSFTNITDEFSSFFIKY